MANEAAIREAFRTQAHFCTVMDAPVTAGVCSALADALNRESRTGAAVLDWPGHPIADALPLRLVGGLNALAQRGHAALVRVFSGRERDPAAVGAILADALAKHDTAILPWLDGPPQTNEAGRAGALMTGLLHVAARFGQPFELLEIGSSAGINLLIDRFAFDLGGVRAGPQDSLVRIAPEWRGNPPPDAEVRFVSVRGVDVQPIDVADREAGRRLASYVWAEAHERVDRLARAIAMILEKPVALEAGDAADWVEARLAEPQAEGVTRVLVHSVVWQYLGDARRGRIAAAMARAGAAASFEHPLAWVRMEPNRDLARHEVLVTMWPGGGETRMVALAHAHGAWIEGL
ncbi:DUF2332 domain-containing protein [Sphingomonas canadensis]|uniref:DUF2332 domain-containing protein n=1 Tax=Sphingomonas canadensis TaxID=1219257 RepID=A0ABW3H8X1_9SPHN|nr:DUF2332 family protein [Sphingomonas canadensis]MCW3836641.1 DUF2332 family protein [Sphingomonas canadensis]